MVKKGKKEKKKEEHPKIDKELEQRIKEEQERLKQKKDSPKKQKKEKELSDKIKPVKQKKWKKEVPAKDIDYQRFFGEQQAKLDYSTLFSYLGNLKVVKYEYSTSDGGVQVGYKNDETMSFERVLVYIQDQKMSKIIGTNNDWQDSDEKTAYKWWAAFNRGMAQVLYELSLT
jgi:hypothetical protein